MIDRHIRNKNAYMKIINEIKSKKLEQGTFHNMKSNKKNTKEMRQKKKKRKRKETTNCFTNEK